MITLLCSNYNSAKWIDGYLESLNSQFLEKFAIVFVDANSNDDSLNTIKKFVFRDGIDVKIIECKDRVGIYDAWNMALDEATTDYVMNYNTDDRLYPAALLTMDGYAKAHPGVDLFYNQYFITNSEEHSSINSLFISPSTHIHDTLLMGCYGGPFPLAKRSALIACGKFNQRYSISGDYDMWLRMSKYGKKFMRVMELIGIYYNNPNGMSTNSKTFEDHVKQDTEIRELNK